MEETKGGDYTPPQETFSREQRRAARPYVQVVELIVSILELDRRIADMLAKKWTASLYWADSGDPAQARADGDVEGRAPVGGRQEVLDVHAYRDAIDQNCIVGTCSINNCLYPDCVLECSADMYALWCDECNAHPSSCPKKRGP